MFTYIEKGEELTRKGKSKEKRYDKNLVAFGIAESDENIPLMHETYPGNVSDAKIFPEIIDKIVEGKMKKYFSEACLLEQAFVKNPDITVQDLLNELIAKTGENIVISRFSRYQLGDSGE